jgi:hypothetical protein
MRFSGGNVRFSGTTMRFSGTNCEVFGEGSQLIHRQIVDKFSRLIPTGMVSERLVGLREGFAIPEASEGFRV